MAATMDPMPTPNPDQDGRSFRSGPIAAGVILLVVGVAMFLDTTVTAHLRLSRLIGPLVLITIGTGMMLDRDGSGCGRRRRGRGAIGVWLVGIGAWMIVVQTQVFGLTYQNSWPLFIVLSGIMMVIRGFK
jgi:cell wall-active antibiotic response 4TMS protein YvqF